VCSSVADDRHHIKLLLPLSEATVDSFILCPLCYFRAVGIGAILTTAFACIFIFAQIIMDGSNSIKPVKNNPHNFKSFFLAFGTILFAFGGASTFPTIQNDMVQKNKFSISVIIGFSGNCLLIYLKLCFKVSLILC
jgi:amino acid permease